VPASTRSLVIADEAVMKLFAIAKTSNADEAAAAPLCDTVSICVNAVPPSTRNKKRGRSSSCSRSKGKTKLKLCQLRTILGIDASETRAVSRLLSFRLNGRASEICSYGVVAVNAFQSFFQKKVTQNTTVQHFRRNFASVLLQRAPI
jgi:hypothetical protein